MTNKPYCPKGSRRCSISKLCVSKKGSRSAKCPKGTRKCANSKCYKKVKSEKSRKSFISKFGK